MVAKKPFSIAIFLLLFFIAAVAGFFLTTRFHTTTKNSADLMSSSDTLPEYANVLVNVATWLPDAGWSDPERSTQNTYYGELKGYKTEGEKTVSYPSEVDGFEMSAEIEKMGYAADEYLRADGPGGANWGYSRSVSGKKQVIVFTYETEPTNTNPNEPVQFKCPCTSKLSAFVSEPFNSDTGE